MSGVTKEALEDLQRRGKTRSMRELGGSINMTLVGQTSGNRANMFSGHIEQMVVLENPETPDVYTGLEKVYGKYTDGIKKASVDSKILHRIEKFPYKPGYHYILVLEDIATKVIDVVEVKHYHMFPEGHGYMRPNTPVDTYPVGSIIRKDQNIYQTNNHDEHDNYRYGVNANIAYVSETENIEDGIVISESFSERVNFWGIEEVEIPLNINDVLLDLYGSDNRFKSFPDVGEYVKDGIVCGSRKVNYSQAAAELTRNSLKELNFTDSPFHGEGQIVDIDIFVNMPEEFNNNPHRLQLAGYYQLALSFNQQIVQILGKYLKKNSGYKCTTKLNDMHHWSKTYINPDIKRSNSSGVFEFALLKIKICKKKHLLHGYKLTNRFGGKGVICHIRKDEYMPYTDDGMRAEVLLSTPSIPARANPGQNTSHALSSLAEFKRKQIIAEPKILNKIKLLQDFLDLVNPNQGKDFKKYIARSSMANKIKILTDVETNRIKIQQDPFEGITFEELKRVYMKEGLVPQSVNVIRKFPDGKIRKFRSKSKVIIAKEYLVVLKHTTGSKFSTRAIGSTNSMGVPSKSNRMEKIGPHSDTPIKIGEMELVNALSRVAPHLVHRLMATHGGNPKYVNKLVNMLLDKDPLVAHDLAIDSEAIIDDVPALAFEAYMYCMGYEIDCIPNEEALAKYEKIIEDQKIM